MEEKKQLLVDYVPPSNSIVQEAAFSTDKSGDKKKHWNLRGVFLQAERENLNQRIYPLDEMTREVNKLDSMIIGGQPIYGELVHPEDLVVNLQNASHIITDLHMEGNDGVGNMKVISTVPAGKIVEGILEEGLPVGVSSRGTGSVDEYTQEVEDFNLITIDIVAQPSAQGAHPMAIYENLRKSKSGQLLLQSAENCIATRDRHTNALNQDIVSFLRNWKI